MTFNKVNPGDLNGFTLFCFNEDEPEIDELGHHQLNSTHPDGFASGDDEEDIECENCGLPFMECECE